MKCLWLSWSLGLVAQHPSFTANCLNPTYSAWATVGPQENLTFPSGLKHYVYSLNSLLIFHSLKENTGTSSFLKSDWLRSTLHTVKCILSKCIVQWVLKNICSHVTTTTINMAKFSTLQVPLRPSGGNTYHLNSQVTTNLFSDIPVSIVLPFSDGSINRLI